MEFSKFDKLIHIVKESGLPESDMIVQTVALFPLFGTSDRYNDKFLTPFALEQIAYALALGLPLVEAAASTGLSATLAKQIYEGERVSLKALVDFGHCVVFARSEMKTKHLTVLERATGPGSSVTFLEKAYANKYGDRQFIDIQTGFGEKDEADKWTVEITHVDNRIKDKDEPLAKFADEKKGYVEDQD